MIQKSAVTNLTKAQALFKFNEARAFLGAVVEMIEQDDGLWTVTIVWDDDQPPAQVSFQDLAAFDETVNTPGEAPVHVEASRLGNEDLGQLSRKFESNGRPGAVGFDTKGGFSYGTYQIATKTGTMDKFLLFLTSQFPSFAQKLAAAGGSAAALAGSDSFRDAWIGLAADSAFADAQHDYIEATHYQPFAKMLLEKQGLDLAGRSAVLRDVAWSVAVQHGPANKVFDAALGQFASTLADTKIIPLVYAERSKVDKHFPSSSLSVRKALVARFASELEIATQRLLA